MYVVMSACGLLLPCLSPFLENEYAWSCGVVGKHAYTITIISYIDSTFTAINRCFMMTDEHTYIVFTMN